MGTAQINGTRLYYEVHGQGDPIVLLHHGFGCTRMWKEIYPRLLASGYQVIMYDRRGYGRSEKGDDFQTFYVSDAFRTESVKDMAELLSVLQVASFHLIGQCEGGVIGVDYAGRYPDQVKTLTTSSTQCYSPVSMPEFNKEKFPYSFRELEPELREKLIRWHGEAHAEAFFEMFRVQGGAYGTGYFDLRDGLARVECPSLVLYPDRSFLFDVDQGVAFYRHLPKGELAVLPDCGHNTYEHQPAEYVRSVLSFLNRHG